MTTAIAIVLSVIPAEEEPNKPLAMAKVLVSTAVLIGSGAALFLIAEKKAEVAAGAAGQASRSRSASSRMRAQAAFFFSRSFNHTLVEELFGALQFAAAGGAEAFAGAVEEVGEHAHARKPGLWGKPSSRRGVRAMTGALFVKRSLGGWVESVVTLRTQRFFGAGFFFGEDFFAVLRWVCVAMDGPFSGA